MKDIFSLLLLFWSFHLYQHQTCDNLLISDFSPQDCANKQNGDTTYYYWIDPGECLPSCKEYTVDGPGRTNCPCPPAYACEKRCSGTVNNSFIVCETNDDCPVRSNCVDMCVADLDSCMAYHAYTSDFMYNRYSALKFKPTCGADGFWEAKQCKGGVSGRCFCFDGKGNRLFGEARYSESKDMTCACSRRKADLEAAGRSYVSFHCDGMGNFEKLQCDNGMCWCVEPKTGELAGPVVPEKAMIKLPCYSASEVGSQYLRQCDSAKYGMNTILSTLRAHGVRYASLGNLLCDGDGAFGIYNISAGIAYCTWRDGSKIGTWQSDTSTDISMLNCNCARDYKTYNHILACDGAGNYKPVQSVVDEGKTIYYCVDSDGFAKSDIAETRIEDYFSPQDCVNKQNEDTTYYYSLHEDQCLPYCEAYSPTSSSGTNCPCPPAYMCKHRCTGSVPYVCKVDDDCPRRSKCIEMCVADKDSCMAYHANTTDFRDNKFTAKFKPICNIDSLWNAKQCKGGVNGRCFCFDGKGNRLFGQAKHSESRDMTCACSRRKADLLNAGRSYVSFHCDSMGNFEKLQCDSGMCWCVEPKTGELIKPVVPQKAMTKLPCYSVSEVGTQYLRQCDSGKYGMTKILNTLKVHGVKYASLGNLLCDGDGAFGNYNVSEGSAYCTWRDGSKIGTWQSDASIDVSTINCNCARDFKMYKHILVCDGTGNYKELQSRVEEGSTIYYCVDSDGFPKSDIYNTRIDCNQYY